VQRTIERLMKIAVTLWWVSTATVLAREPQWNIRDMARESVTVIAHRGAGYLAPENTMEALERPGAWGAFRKWTFARPKTASL